MSVPPIKSDRELMLEVMIHERNGLRAELIEYQKSMHKIIFAFITIGGISASIYFDNGKTQHLKELSLIHENSLIFFLILQFEVFLALLGATLLAGQSMHAGYIAALERKINDLMNAKVSIWESEVVPYIMERPNGSFWMANLFLYLFVLGIFASLTYAIYDVISWKRLALLAFELIALIILFIWSIIDTQRVGRFADKILGCETKHHD